MLVLKIQECLTDFIVKEKQGHYCDVPNMHT